MHYEGRRVSNKTKGGYRNDPEGAFDAVWDFMVEHSEILPSGAYFIKFHAKGKQNVINRFKARFYYGYHREDVHQKKLLANQFFLEDQRVRKAKKEKYERSKKYARVGAFTKKYLPLIHRIIFKKRNVKIQQRNDISSTL